MLAVIARVGADAVVCVPVFVSVRTGHPGCYRSSSIQGMFLKGCYFFIASCFFVSSCGKTVKGGLSKA